MTALFKIAARFVFGDVRWLTRSSRAIHRKGKGPVDGKGKGSAVGSFARKLYGEREVGLGYSVSLCLLFVVIYVSIILT